LPGAAAWQPACEREQPLSAVAFVGLIVAAPSAVVPFCPLPVVELQELVWNLVRDLAGNPGSVRGRESDLLMLDDSVIDLHSMEAVTSSHPHCLVSSPKLLRKKSIKGEKRTRTSSSGWFSMDIKTYATGKSIRSLPGKAASNGAACPVASQAVMARKHAITIQFNDVYGQSSHDSPHIYSREILLRTTLSVPCHA
jgi:hypothetical protein